MKSNKKDLQQFFKEWLERGNHIIKLEKKYNELEKKHNELQKECETKKLQKSKERRCRICNISEENSQMISAFDIHTCWRCYEKEEEKANTKEALKEKIKGLEKLLSVIIKEPDIISRLNKAIDEEIRLGAKQQ